MAEGEAQAGAHPWEKSYPENIDWNAPLPKAPLQRLLDDAVAKFGDRPAIDFMDRVTTYRELGQLANQAAEGFQKLGVGKGTKVGILLPNCTNFVAVYYGVLKAGGTVVNVNPLYAIEEIKSQIEDSETDILVTLDLSILYDKARIALDQTRLTHLVICPMADMLPGLKKLLFPLVKRSEIAKIPRDSRHVFFRKLTDNAGRPTPIEVEVDEDIAVLQYTGGTTGTSKGAMLTHANLSANVAQAAMMMPDAEEGREVMIGVLPLFHVFAMAVVMNFSIRLGAKMILLPRFELDTVLKVVDKKRPTFFPAVPTIYIAINGHPDVAAGKYDLSSIKLCLSGGASLPREVQEKFQELSGCTLVEGYGLSETAPVATCNPTTPGGSREGSLGVPVPGTVVDICSIDDPEKVLPQGEIGEICISGPQVMKGYWKRDEENARAFAGGRFHTGDVGKHRRGWLRLSHRPAQGGHHRRRLQRLSAPRRGGDLQARVGAGGDGHRRRRRPPPADRQGLRPAEGRPETHRRRADGVPQGQAVPHRDAQADRVPRRAAEDDHRQALQEGADRRRGHEAGRGCRRLRLNAARRRHT